VIINKMARLSIRGNRTYVSRLSKHLKKEHPSTKKRMKVTLNNKIVKK